MLDGLPSRKAEITASHSSQPLCKTAGGRIQQLLRHLWFKSLCLLDIFTGKYCNICTKEKGKRKDTSLQHHLLS